MPYASNLNL